MMDEYIEREIRYIDIKKVTIPRGFFEGLNVPKLLDWLNSQPSADVVEVVRCKDCIYSHRDNDYRFGYACEKPLYHPQMGETRQRKLMQDIDFCSYGVRKTS